MPILKELGITSKYQGYSMVIAALSVMDHVPGILTNTMQIYTCVGQAMNVAAHNVERNIRTVAHLAWSENRDYLEKLAGYSLSKAPSAGEFLSILYLRRGEK